MSKGWLKDLNQQQKEAVCFGEGPLLILAGAGSGKTRALTYRAAWLTKEQQINPDQILLLTFTNKAAGEMKTRIKHLVKGESPFAGTFHSFCVKLLRIEGHKIGLDKNFAIFDQQDQLDLVKASLLRLNLDPKAFKPNSLLQAISSAKNELINASEYSGYARGYWQKTLAQVYFIYQKLLTDYSALDFDDLLMKTVILLQKNQPVLNYYQNKYHFVLVDEYQDTNRAQYVLTKLLTGRWNNLTVVGDCSQSIYRWRGADFRNILNLQNDFPNLTTINLEQNYRSTDNILAAAYKIISHNHSHPILKLWTKKGSGKKLTIFEAKDEKEEADFIAQKIIELTVSHSQIAVLYRTNAQSRVLEEAFLTHGLPYVLIGGTRFYERREIKDCLAYLRLLHNPKDMISFKRIQKLGKKRFDKFLALAERLEKMLDRLTTTEILNQVFKTTGYLERYDKKNEEDLVRLENIKELKSVTREFPQLDEFLIQVALVEQEHFASGRKISKSSQEAVNLMTLHAAKGLEFKLVFMVGMEEGLFPHSRSMLEKDELEEERRLCYVGITRAKEKLFLSHTRRRLYFGRRSSNLISRFVADIPNRLLEVERQFPFT
ncbi:exodeoxyribonuclease V subunit gamma [Patescibacteria group bacterium]|nr:exodeoxyribonuclease V subunit gamma [Patescibacteria group bacterium]MBU1931106.1 exodeoxyribonuclease V subunit gamma [Patescibacteria group bacterium]